MDTFWRKFNLQKWFKKKKIKEIISEMILPNIIKFKEYVLLILHKFFQSVETEGRLKSWHEGGIILISKSEKDRMRKENNRSFCHEHKYKGMKRN